MLNTALLTAAGFFASHFHLPVPLALGAALALTLWMFRLHIQPLVALSDKQVSEARKREGFWLFVLIVLSALR